MDRNKLWIIGASILMVAIIAVGWVAAIQPQLDAAAAADQQRATVDATNLANRAALVKLQADSKNLPDLKTQLASLNKSVPTSPQLPAFVTELNSLAGTYGVTITGITFADAIAYKPVDPPATAAPPAATSTATPSPSPANTPVATPEPAAPAAGMPPVTSPLITTTNFAAIPATVAVSGPNANVLAFVHGVQFGDRLFLLSSLSTNASTSGDGGVDGKIGGLIYVLVQPTAPSATK